MCLIKKFTDVYPGEVRTRQTIYRCVFSNGDETCSRTRIDDRGEVYHAHRPRSEDEEGRRTHTYRVMVPTDPGQPERTNKRSSRRNWRSRDKELVFEFHIPFTKKTLKSGERTYERDARDTGRTADGFVLNSPEQYMPHEQPTEEQPDQQAHEMLPRNSIPQSTFAQQPLDPVVSPDTPGPEQISRPSRRPRERTPVSERVPLRGPPGTSNSVVEIHNNLPGDETLTPTLEYSARKPRVSPRVHFAINLDREGDRRHKAENDREYEMRRHRYAEGDLYRAHLRVQNAIRERELAERETNSLRRFIKRNLRSRHSVPQSRREGGAEERHLGLIEGRYSTEIIQDGNRQISDAGDRIISEAEARHNRMGFLRDFHGRPSRRSNGDQHHGSNSGRRDVIPGNEDIIYEAGYRRHGWRWQ